MSRRNRKCGRKLRRRRGRTCLWCDAALTKAEATVEHLVPKSLGGPDSPWNLAWACGKCNSRRGSDVNSPEVRGRLAEALEGRDVPESWRPAVCAIVAGRYHVFPLGSQPWRPP